MNKWTKPPIFMTSSDRLMWQAATQKCTLSSKIWYNWNCWKWWHWFSLMDLFRMELSHHWGTNHEVTHMCWRGNTIAHGSNFIAHLKSPSNYFLLHYFSSIFRPLWKTLKRRPRKKKPNNKLYLCTPKITLSFTSSSQSPIIKVCLRKKPCLLN